MLVYVWSDDELLCNNFCLLLKSLSITSIFLSPKIAFTRARDDDPLLTLAAAIALLAADNSPNLDLCLLASDEKWVVAMLVGSN